MGEFKTDIDSFNLMVEAIASKYSAQIKLKSAQQGKKPIFEDLLEELKTMQAELTKEGANFIKSYTDKSEHEKQVLVGAVKESIQTAIETFVKSL